MSITLRAVAFDCTECDSTTSSPGAASLRSMLSISPKAGSSTWAAAFTAAAGLVRTAPALGARDHRRRDPVPDAEALRVRAAAAA